MTDLGFARAQPFGPPLKNGLAAIILFLLALAYAWLAIPSTLIPHQGLLNLHGGATGNDFLAFYSAALMAWSPSVADVYDTTRLFPFQGAVSGTAMHLPFPYPPSFLLYVAPLAAMNYLPALYVWLAATSLPFVWIVRKLSSAAAPLILLAPPLVQNAVSGQNGALTASLFAGGLYALSRQRPVLAGLLFALLSYKPQVFILIPICLLAAREYRALASLIATGVCLLLASAMAFGIDIWEKFIAFAPQQLAFVLDGRLPVTRCPTVFMFVFHTSHNLTLANLAQAATTLAAWCFIGWAWRRAQDVFTRALAFCIALPLSTPYMLEYDLAIWTLPAAILLVRIWRGEATRFDGIAVIFLWLLPPMIWLTSSAALHLSVLALIPLAIYAMSTVCEQSRLEMARIEAS